MLLYYRVSADSFYILWDLFYGTQVSSFGIFRWFSLKSFSLQSNLTLTVQKHSFTQNMNKIPFMHRMGHHATCCFYSPLKFPKCNSASIKKKTNAAEYQLKILNVQNNIVYGISLHAWIQFKLFLLCCCSLNLFQISHHICTGCKQINCLSFRVNI